MKQEQQRSDWKSPFSTIQTGQAVLLLVGILVQFAMIWWIAKSTGSAMALAVTMLVAMLPGALIGPFANALIDRLDQRAVMIVADSIIALAAVGLTYLVAVSW